MRSISVRFVLCLSILIFSAPWIGASQVRQFNLEGLYKNAGHVFSGTVTEKRFGTVWAGGAEFPTVTYRFLLAETYKGNAADIGNRDYVEMTMLDSLEKQSSGRYRFYSNLPEMPDMKIGQRYLIFATAPSAIGLSSTVGLSQGCFRIVEKGYREIVVNGNNNAGLFLNMAGAPNKRGDSGSLSLDTMIHMVRTEMKKGGN